MNELELFLDAIKELNISADRIDEIKGLTWENERAFEHSLGESMQAFVDMLGSLTKVLRTWRDLPAAARHGLITEMQKMEEES